MTTEEEELRQKLLAETRADLFKRQLSNAENYDRSILSVSTAFLGFSLLFLKDFVPANLAQWLWLLYGSWVMFTCAVLTIIISFLVSQSAINVQLEKAEDYYLRGNEAALERSVLTKAADWFNAISGIFFVLGVLSSTGFVIKNFERGSVMSNKQTGSKSLNEGAPIPQMQRLEKGMPVPNIQRVPQSTQTQSQNTPTPPASSSKPSSGTTKK